jgi:hypothetical protein
MIEVGPEPTGEAAGFDFAAAYASEAPSAFALEIAIITRLHPLMSSSSLVD